MLSVGLWFSTCLALGLWGRLKGLSLLLLMCVFVLRVCAEVEVKGVRAV